MRFTGNFFSETRRGSSNHSLLAALVACALGATASGAVILSLAGPPTTQPGVSSISPRAIVRNAGTSEPTQAPQNRPVVETPTTISSTVSGRDKLVTQNEAEPQVEVHSQQSPKHSQQHSRGPHWQRRSAHAFWQLPRFSSRRDELTSGAR